MKKTILFSLLLINSFVFSQTMTTGCEENNEIPRNETHSFELVTFDCAKYILMNDDSIVFIYDVEGSGMIVRLKQENAGKRPKVILVGCKENFKNISFNDVEVVFDETNCSKKGN